MYTGSHEAFCEWPVTTTVSAGNQRNGVTMTMAQEVTGIRDLGMQSSLATGASRTPSSALQPQVSLTEWEDSADSPTCSQCSALSLLPPASYVMQVTKGGIRICRQDIEPF